MNDTAAPPGTQAVDRAAALLIDTVVPCRRAADVPRDRGVLRAARSTTSRLLAALERTGLLERDRAGSTSRGPLFWLYAARHDPCEELVRLARPTMERSARTPARPCTSASPAASRSCRSPRSTPATCSAARDWTEIEVRPLLVARQGVLAWGALPLPTGRLARRPRPASATRRRWTRPGQVRRRGFAVTRRRARGRARRRRRAGPRCRTATWSPPSASRDPPHGSRTGSTSSAAS